jgi:CheY-like chemotaxis protein
VNYKTILIIDDEEFVRNSLVRELRQEKLYKVDCAASGEEAIEKVKKEKYDLYFIDLMMPGIDGIETCKSIRDLSPESEFICFTGLFDKTLSLGVSNHIDAGGRTRLLYKPFREKTFLQTAQEILAVV